MTNLTLDDMARILLPPAMLPLLLIDQKVCLQSDARSLQST